MKLSVISAKQYLLLKQFLRSKTIQKELLAISASVGLYVQTGNKVVLCGILSGLAGIVIRYLTYEPMEFK